MQVWNWKFKPIYPWKIGLGMVLSSLWEGFGQPGASFGHSWAPLGCFWSVQNRAFFEHGSKMNSKESLGSIWERFGQGFGMGLGRFGKSLGKGLCWNLKIEAFASRGCLLSILCVPCCLTFCYRNPRAASLRLVERHNTILSIPFEYARFLTLHCNVVLSNPSNTFKERSLRNATLGVVGLYLLGAWAWAILCRSISYLTYHLLIKPIVSWIHNERKIAFRIVATAILLWSLLRWALLCSVLLWQLWVALLWSLLLHLFLLCSALLCFALLWFALPCGHGRGSSLHSI